jgi:hypothetical protein
MIDVFGHLGSLSVGERRRCELRLRPSQAPDKEKCGQATETSGGASEPHGSRGVTLKSSLTPDRSRHAKKPLTLARPLAKKYIEG